MSAIIAISQYGDKVILEGKHPRKELAEQYAVNSSSLQKMYVDTKDGQTKHVGYIVCGLWFTLHELTEWAGKA